jgi:hypothetical protein
MRISGCGARRRFLGVHDAHSAGEQSNDVEEALQRFVLRMRVSLECFAGRPKPACSFAELLIERLALWCLLRSRAAVEGIAIDGADCRLAR